MNREIKFRAWNPDDAKMEYPLVFEICTDGALKPLINCSDGNRAYKDYPLMQYTGLKDINGKEIYEGDIVKSGSRTMQLVFKQEACQFWLIWKDYDGINRFKPLTATYWDDNNSFINDSIQVIGNIYENPELLNT